VPVYMINGKLIGFVHIPKAGGRSVEISLRKMGRESMLNPNKMTPLPCSPQHFHAELLDYLFPKGFFDFRFALVRHPMHRIVSEYKMRMGQRARQGLDIPDASDWIQYAIGRYREDRYAFDNHLRPQSEFTANCDSVYKLETDLDKMYTDISTIISVPVEASKSHVGKSMPAIKAGSITSRVSEAVFELYREDFDNFHYEM
jgi:hypothetical protein